MYLRPWQTFLVNIFLWKQRTVFSHLLFPHKSSIIDVWHNPARTTGLIFKDFMKSCIIRRNMDGKVTEVLVAFNWFSMGFTLKQIRVLLKVSFEELQLTLSWRRPLSYRNYSSDLLCKSVDWYLYDRDLHHERVSPFHHDLLLPVRFLVGTSRKVFANLF